MGRRGRQLVTTGLALTLGCGPGAAARAPERPVDEPPASALAGTIATDAAPGAPGVLVAHPTGDGLPDRCDGDRVDAWCHPLPAGAIARFGSGAGEVGSALAVAPGAKRWVTADSLDDICLWSAATGLLERCIPEIKAAPDTASSVIAITFTDGGAKLAVMTYEELFLVDVARGSLEVRVALASDSDQESRYSRYESSFRAHSMAVSPAGDRIAVGVCSERTAGVVRLYDASGKRLATHEVPPNDSDSEVCADAVAFSHSGKLLAASRRNLVLVWDGKGELVGHVDTRDTAIQALAFSADDRELAIAGWGDAINVVSTTTWNVTRAFGYLQGSLNGGDHLAWSPGGKWLVADHGATTRVFDVESGALTLALERASSPAFVSDEELLVMNGRGVHMVARHALPSGERLAPFDLSRHDDAAVAVALRADGQVGATVARDGVRTWDVPSGKPRRFFLAPERVSFAGIAFLRDGSLLVATDDARLHRVGADADAGTAPVPLGSLAGGAPRREVIGLAASPTSDVVALVLADATLRRWDAATGTELSPLQLVDVSGAHATPTAPAWSRDGATIAVGIGAEVWLVDAASGAVKQRIALLEDETVVGVDFAKARDELAILGDRRAVLVDVSASGAPKLALSIERDEPIARGTIRYASGGARVAIADEALHVFDAPSGRRVAELAIDPARSDLLAVVGAFGAAPQSDGTTLLFDLGAVK